MAGDVTKLPKWAQEEITNLKREVAHWKRSYETACHGASDSRVSVTITHQGPPMKLPEHVSINFKMGEGRDEWLRVSLRTEWDRTYVEVMSGGSDLVVKPQVSNVVRLFNLPRR